MPWERRRKSRGRYYTRTYCRNGRRIRVYVGTGTDAERAAREDAEARARRQAETQAFDEMQLLLAELDRPVHRLNAACQDLLHAALMLLGYHLHQRGEWRRRRERHTGR